MRHSFRDQTPEPKTADKNPIAQRIIEAVERSYDVTLEDVETLLRVIKENQMPVQFKSPFEVNGHEDQWWTGLNGTNPFREIP